MLVRRWCWCWCWRCVVGVVGVGGVGGAGGDDCGVVGVAAGWMLVLGMVVLVVLVLVGRC